MFLLTREPRRRCERPGAWANPLRGMTMSKRTCTVEGCGRNVEAREWCHKHYYEPENCRWATRLEQRANQRVKGAT